MVRRRTQRPEAALALPAREGQHKSGHCCAQGMGRSEPVCAGRMLVMAGLSSDKSTDTRVQQPARRASGRRRGRANDRNRGPEAAGPATVPPVTRTVPAALAHLAHHPPCGEATTWRPRTGEMGDRRKPVTSLSTWWQRAGHQLRTARHSQPFFSRLSNPLVFFFFLLPPNRRPRNHVKIPCLGATWIAVPECFHPGHRGGRPRGRPLTIRYLEQPLRQTWNVREHMFCGITRCDAKLGKCRVCDGKSNLRHSAIELVQHFTDVTIYAREPLQA